MFDRREFLELAASAMLGGTSANVHSESGANGTPSEAGQVGNNAGKLKSRPNIILFMPDEMRADSLGCFGNEVCKTPNFDRLSSEGTRFSNCHVQFPACGASRCSLLTGWPTSVRGHRSLYYFLRPEEPNLFRYLRQAGYDVFWFGKNDALAAQCFADSVTQWAEPDMAVLRGSMQVSDVTPGSFSMLLTAGGEREPSRSSKEKRRTGRSAFSCHCSSRIRPTRCPKTFTTCTLRPIFHRLRHPDSRTNLHFMLGFANSITWQKSTTPLCAKCALSTTDK